MFVLAVLILLSFFFIIIMIFTVPLHVQLDSQLPHMHLDCLERYGQIRPVKLSHYMVLILEINIGNMRTQSDRLLHYGQVSSSDFIAFLPPDKQSVNEVI